MYYVYILYSATIDKYYIGYSADTNERLYKHNKKHKGFTGQTDDWLLVYKEIFTTKQEALQRGEANKKLEKPKGN